jgi:hypothetical protein
MESWYLTTPLINITGASTLTAIGAGTLLPQTTYNLQLPQDL